MKLIAATPITQVETNHSDFGIGIHLSERYKEDGRMDGCGWNKDLGEALGGIGRHWEGLGRKEGWREEHSTQHTQGLWREIWEIWEIWLLFLASRAVRIREVQGGSRGEKRGG